MSTQAILSGASDPSQLQTTMATVPQQPQQAAPVPPAQDPNAGQQQPPANQPAPQGGGIWERILSGALEGLAGGGAQRGGLGASGGFSAAGAGFVAAKQAQQADQDRQQAQQAAAVQARRQAVLDQQHDQAASDDHALKVAQGQMAAFNLGHATTLAAQQKMKFNSDMTGAANDQLNAIHAENGTQVATGKDPMDAINNSEDAKQLGSWQSKGELQAVNHYAADGSIDHVDLYHIPTDVLDAPTTQDTPLYSLGLDKDGQVTLKTQTAPAGSTTPRKANAYNATVLSKYMQQQMQMKKDAADNKAKVTVAGINAAAKKGANGAGDAADVDPTLVDQVGQGKMVPERLAYLLSRNPALLDAVAKKYPNFDSSKAQAYPKVYAEFTSTKNGTAGGALNAGGTALGHLAELRALNTPASHIPRSPAWTAYQNKAATVSTELAKFYGDTTIPAIANIQNTLTSTLPGNREAAITTQAQSMGDKLDAYEQTWKNAAPSPLFQSPMPGISPRAKAARASLDPAYAKRISGGQKPAQQQQATPAQPGQNPTPPAGATNPVYGADGKTLIGYAVNGKFAPIAGGN